MSREERLEFLLSEGFDLCARARKLDDLDRQQAALESASVASTKCGTLPLWASQQYERDLADWEKRAREFLLGPVPEARSMGK